MRTTRSARRGLASALLAGALATACVSGGTAGEDAGEERQPTDQSTPAAGAYPGIPDEIARQRLSWRQCDAPTVAQGGGDAPEPLADGTPWECSTLTVPLDYGEPEGETIPVALIRAAGTAEDSERIGSLIFNFGGPGASGVHTLPQLAEDYASLREGYDLVSFDPRGVGESAGVTCWDGPRRDAAEQELGSLPDTEEEERLEAELTQDYVAACQENSGALLPHLTTENTARDLDLLRHVLGDTTLHYFGISYGTELGAGYAHLFPENVGRAVLDAVVDPEADEIEGFLQQIAGFQLALEHYMADCAAASGADACPTGDGGEEGGETLRAFLADLADAPLPTTDPDRDLTQNLAVTGVIAALYSEETWTFLTQALTQATEGGDGSLLLLLADFYNGRDDQGRYSNQADAHTAISCADTPPVEDGQEGPGVDFEAASPVFGPFIGDAETGCEDWPVSADGDLEVGAEGAAEILLIGTTGDPATPYEGTARMRDALGEGVGVMITYDGEGHGAYTSGDRCVTRATDAYLLQGLVPTDGLVCG